MKNSGRRNENRSPKHVGYSFDNQLEAPFLKTLHRRSCGVCQKPLGKRARFCKIDCCDHVFHYACGHNHTDHSINCPECHKEIALLGSYSDDGTLCKVDCLSVENSDSASSSPGASEVSSTSENEKDSDTENEESEVEDPVEVLETKAAPKGKHTLVPPVKNLNEKLRTEKQRKQRIERSPSMNSERKPNAKKFCSRALEKVDTTASTGSGNGSVCTPRKNSVCVSNPYNGILGSELDFCPTCSAPTIQRRAHPTDCSEGTPRSYLQFPSLQGGSPFVYRQANKLLRTDSPHSVSRAFPNHSWSPAHPSSGPPCVPIQTLQNSPISSPSFVCTSEIESMFAAATAAMSAATQMAIVMQQTSNRPEPREKETREILPVPPGLPQQTDADGDIVML